MRCFYPDRHLTLASFIPRKGNQQARAGGIQFICSRRAQPDILIVVGRSGSGKSHLLHALANFAKAHGETYSIACMSAVQFAEEVMCGQFYDDLGDVLSHYTRAHFLAVDDVDQILHQPAVADILLALMRIRMRQNRGQRTLLAFTMYRAPTVQHPLADFLDKQLAVRLL